MIKLLLILFIISYFQIRLEDVFSLTIFHLQWGLQDIFKTCLQDVFFKAFSRHFFNTSHSRRLQYFLKTSSRKRFANTLWRHFKAFLRRSWKAKHFYTKEVFAQTIAICVFNKASGLYCQRQWWSLWRSLFLSSFSGSLF